jgi:LysM repeat protein
VGAIGDMLQTKLLGLPAWVWGLVIGGGIVAYAYISRSTDDGPEVAPVAPPDGGFADAGDAGDIPGLPTIPDQSTPVTTNPAWVRVVTDRLVAQGYDPVQVNNALTKGLAGINLTAQEAALWNEAVRRFGAPPEGAPPIVVDGPALPPVTAPPVTTPPVTAPPVTTPPAAPKRTHTVQKGDSLWSIAQRYYGTGSKFMTIYWANEYTIVTAARQHGKNSNYAKWIFPGTVLVIP